MVCCFLHHQAQTPEPPCWYTPNWDWTIFDGENWKGYWTNQESTPYMGSPFQNTSNTDIQDVIDASDFREEQGWVLLYKNFGCFDTPVQAGMPHFFLYNKFTAVIRMFYYVPSEAFYLKAKVEIEWYSTDNTSLLTHGRKMALPNDEYSMGDNAERTLFIIEDQPANGAWVMAEQLVHFDHTDLQETDAYWLKVIFTNMTESAVLLNGTFEFTTKSMGVKDQNTTPSSESNGFQEFLTDTKDRIGKLPKPADVDKFIQSIQTVFPGPDPETVVTWEPLDPDAHYDWTVDPMFDGYPMWASAGFPDENPHPFTAVNTVVEHTKFQEKPLYKYLMLGLKTVAPGVGQGIGLLLNVMNVFSGKATNSGTSAPALQPTVSSGSITLNGTITTETDGGNVFLQLPGMAHNISADFPENWSGLPVYDCPLGNLALESMPTIQKKIYLVKTGRDCSSEYDNFAGLSFTSCHDNYLAIDSYHFDQDLPLALNASSDLNIDMIWAGFTAELDGPLKDKFYSTNGEPLHAYGSPSYDASSDSEPLDDYNGPSYDASSDFNFGNAWEEPQVNPIRLLTENGTYSITGAANGQPVSVSTPLIPIEEFKHTTFNIYHGAKVYLKVAAVMSPISDSYEPTPVLWTTTYEILEDKFVIEQTLEQALEELSNWQPWYPSEGIFLSSGYPFTWEQQHNRNSDMVLSLLPSPSVVQGVIDDGQYSAFNILADEVHITNTQAGVDLKAEHRIKMTTGLKVFAAENKKFKATIERTLPYTTGKDAGIVNVYNSNCNPAQIKRMIADREAQEQATPLAFGIYSGLVSNTLMLKCPQGDQYQASIDIYSSTGQLVESLYLSSMQDKSLIDLHHLADGAYLVKGSVAGAVFCQPFVKTEP
jgi:hypothetical protein